MTTLNTNDSLAKHYQPIVWPESVKAESRSGWGIITLIVTGLAALISLTSYFTANYKNLTENAVISPTSVPGQFSVTLPDALNSGWVYVFLAVALIVAVAVLVNAFKDDKAGTGVLAIIVISASVIFAVLISVKSSWSYLETDAPLTHLSEQAGIEFVHSSYNEDNGILSVSDDTSSYNFLASEGKNTEGKKVIYLTVQQ